MGNQRVKPDMSKIDRDKYKVSAHDVKEVLKLANIPREEVTKEKRELVKIGCECLLLSFNDIVYMCNPNISYRDAEKRMSAKRLSSFNR